MEWLFEHRPHARCAEPIVPNAQDEFALLQVAMIQGATDPGMNGQIAGFPVTAQQLRSVIHPYLAPMVDFTDFLHRRNVHLLFPHDPLAKKIPENKEEAQNVFGGEIFCRDALGVIDQSVIRSDLPLNRRGQEKYYTPVSHRLAPSAEVEHVGFLPLGNIVLHDEAVLTAITDVTAGETQKIHAVLAGFGDTNDRNLVMEFLQQLDAKTKALAKLEKIIEGKRRLLKIKLFNNCDMDSVVAPLPRKRTEERKALIQRECIHPEGLAVLEKIFDVLIPIEDRLKALGANILWVDPQTPVLATEARNTRKKLRELGFDVHDFPWEEFSVNVSEGENGGWRCVTGVLRREKA